MEGISSEKPCSRERLQEWNLESKKKRYVSAQTTPLQCVGYLKAELLNKSASTYQILVLRGNVEALIGRKICFDLKIQSTRDNVNSVEQSPGIFMQLAQE